MKLTYHTNIDFLKKLYLNKTNINQYLRKKTNLSETEIIKLSYDIQSGSYIKITIILNQKKF